MRVMRVVVAVLAVLVAMPVLAQGGMGDGQGRGQMQQRQNELLFKGITLSEAQRVKIDSLQAANREAMMALMQGGGLQDPAAREKAAAMREQHHKDIRAVLTPDQQAQFDKNLAEMPQRGPGARRPPGRR